VCVNVDKHGKNSNAVALHFTPSFPIFLAMDPLVAAPPTTRAVIDLEAFRSNLDAVRSYIGSQVKVLAVVKADAYGHGALRIATEAIRRGVDYLGVARIHEGLELRMEGITDPILVFGVAPADQLETAVRQGLELTVVSLKGASLIDEAAARLGKRAMIHVKVDTGMGRLGFSVPEAISAIERMSRMKGVTLAGLYSHFATSEDRDQSFARGQVDRFREIIASLAARGISIPLKHMANSGAIIALPDAHFDMVRPGIMLYGYPPGRDMDQRFPVRPVMSLVSQITFLKTVDAGTSISYGRKYFTAQRTAVATVPIGYADGYARLLTGRAEALVRGRRYPVVGTICMDAVMLDLGPNTDVAEGDVVTFIGEDGVERITAWDIAARIGSIPYEVTCLITKRVQRLYKSP
jgi:alanine racemase